ncbi:MAG: hypothetical protein JF611_08805 [Betaproteobacteria bacterium]|nr:hypothetical protein [Betaproteobacteria bacterium]
MNEFANLVIAGWTGRDEAALPKHIRRPHRSSIAFQVRGRVTERNVVNTITRGLERLVGELKGPVQQ